MSDHLAVLISCSGVGSEWKNYNNNTVSNIPWQIYIYMNMWIYENAAQHTHTHTHNTHVHVHTQYFNSFLKAILLLN